MGQLKWKVSVPVTSRGLLPAQPKRKGPGGGGVTIIPVFVVHPLTLDLALSQEECGGKRRVRLWLKHCSGLVNLQAPYSGEEALRIRTVDFA
jgi:hypothetical protein